MADVIVLGAGAAGLHCAHLAARRGLDVLLLDHAKQAGKKILISGGGRCNFTNLHTAPDAFLSANPHFCKSALSRYTQWDFLALVEQYNIAWHEKTLGQLFCDDSAKQIVNMLLSECKDSGAQVQLRTEIFTVAKSGHNFVVSTSQGEYQAPELVVATGGLSMPKLGATPLGYQLAEQFGHSIQPVRAGLVPFTLQPADKKALADLSGVATDVHAHNERAGFREALLFTHRGLSGPAILQISSYWQPGESVKLNLLPETDLSDWLKKQRDRHPRQNLTTALQQQLPKRLVQTLAEYHQWPSGNLADCSNQILVRVAAQLNDWQLTPGGTEGYRTAEVTIGGVDVNELSSRTMASRQEPGLYFIGEVVDVTGWLGGYNFQWAWSSAAACAESLTGE